MRTHPHVPVLILMLAILIALLLYYPGLSGPLLFDDVHVLTNNSLLNISSLELAQLVPAMESFNGDGRQISMLSFALNLYFLGDSTWWLKCVNLIIHCVNGVLIFIIASKTISIVDQERRDSLANSRLLAAISVSIWLVSPINLTAVLYISQRMTLLSTFFVLSGLCAYIYARIHIKQTRRKALYIPLIIVGFTATGYLCKENAALLPLFVATIEFVAFRFKTESKIDKVIVSLFVLGMLLAVLGSTYLLFMGSDWLFSGYEHRDFSLLERGLTQFRVLIFYLSQILLPTNTSLSLWHDDFGISTGLLSPPATLLSAILICALIFFAVAVRRKYPVLTIGIMWFFLAHLMESTILPLELVHEHRNYLASFGVLLSITYLVLVIFSLNVYLRWTVYMALVCMIVWNALVLSERARIWSNNYKLAQHGASTHPKSFSANFQLARLQYLRFLDGEAEYGSKAKTSYLKARSLQSDQLVVELTLVLASEDGAFDYDSEWLETAAKKFPSALKSAPLQAAVISFLECLDWKRCAKSSQDAHKIFDLFRESDDHYFVNFYALYYWKIDFQPQKAEPAFERALKGTDVRFWTYYFQYLVENEKWTVFCGLYPEFESRLKAFEFTNTAGHMTVVSNLRGKFSQCSISS